MPEDEDALNDEFSMMQDDEDDDFNNFDAARYLRKRRGGRTYGDPNAADDLTGDDDYATPGYSSRRSGSTARRRSQMPIIDAEANDPGPLQLIFGGMEPGIRMAVIGIGCFAIIFCIGACGLAIWVISTLANR